MNPTSLFISVTAGAIGTGYFFYGKKQGLFVPLFSGMALCIYPYFIENIWLMLLIGIALCAAPFIWRE